MQRRAFTTGDEAYAAAEPLAAGGEALGVLRYRRQQMIQNRGQMIVVVKEHFGIFSFHEFAELAGFEVS